MPEPAVTTQPKPTNSTPASAPIVLGAPPSENSALNIQGQTTYTPGSLCSAKDCWYKNKCNNLVLVCGKLFLYSIEMFCFSCF